MSIWEAVNSPIILTIISFLLVGVLASAISAAWQRRSQRHSVRLLLAKEILDTYHEYIRYLRREETIEDPNEFDRLHSDMLSKATMAKVLFNKDIAHRLRELAHKLANVQDLRVQGRVQKAQNKRTEVIIDTDAVIERIFMLLK
jgi:hypothetical protein